MDGITLTRIQLIRQRVIHEATLLLFSNLHLLDWTPPHTMAGLDQGQYLNDSEIGLNLDPASPTTQYESFFGDTSSFSHTPSYNGSYNNSPYSGASELSFQDEDNNSAFGGLFAGSDIHIANARETVYDPTDYDTPDANGLLMFSDDYANGLAPYDPTSTSGISLTAHQQQPYGDYSSPSSNGGDSGNENSRSRGSSVSSQHHPHLTPSPRLQVAQSFENLNFQSPSWGANGLPLDQHQQAGAGISHYSHQPSSSMSRTRSLSPNNRQANAQSPPRLLVPDSERHLYSGPPVINAPDGDGDNGPALNVVPATPVGNAVAGGHPPSHNGMMGYNADMFRAPSPHQMANKAFAFPREAHQQNNNYLFAHPPRSRSKSETQLSSPVSSWGNTPFGRESDESALSDDFSSPPAHQAIVNMNDVSPEIPSSSPPAFPPPNNNYLSVDGDYGLGPTSLRRSRSENGRAMGHNRGSRSEDIRLTPQNAQGNLLSVPGMWSGSQYLTPGYGPSMPPPMPSSSAQFSHQQPSSQAAYGRMAGHHRRASSGSRSERGTTATWGVEPASSSYTGSTIGNGGEGGKQRHSPYPSPNHSPLVHYDDLPHGDPLDGLGGSNSVVSKQNVTTTRTAKASRVRRKQEATYHCPIAGCGSSFTRSFNLKGQYIALR